MITKIEPVEPVVEILTKWLQAERSFFGDISSLFTVIPGNSPNAQLPTELVRRLFSTPLGQEVLKSLQNYSICSLSTFSDDRASTQNGHKESHPVIHQKSSSQPQVHREVLLGLTKQAAPNPALAIPQATHKILQEVLYSLTRMSSLPTEEKANALQIKDLQRKISSIMDQFVRPIKESCSSDFMSREEPIKNLKFVERKSSKSSVPTPPAPSPISNKAILDDRVSIQPKKETLSSQPPAKMGIPDVHRLTHQVMSPPTTQAPPERTTIPGAPLAPTMPLSRSSRKEKKRQQFTTWDEEDREEKKDKDQ